MNKPNIASTNNKNKYNTRNVLVYVEKVSDKSQNPTIEIKPKERPVFINAICAGISLIVKSALKCC